jgi:yeast amino acid transporter
MDIVPGYWGGFLAFWYTLSQAAFSFIGTEIVALAAAEAEEPRRNIPRAVHRVFFRIALFYIAGMTYHYIFYFKSLVVNSRVNT